MRKFIHIYYRLQGPILHLLWDVMEKFFGYNKLPQTRTYLDETWNISEGHSAHSHKKNEGNCPRVGPKRAKTWFVLFLSPMQNGLRTKIYRAKNLF